MHKRSVTCQPVRVGLLVGCLLNLTAGRTCMLRWLLLSRRFCEWQYSHSSVRLSSSAVRWVGLLILTFISFRTVRFLAFISLYLICIFWLPFRHPVAPSARHSWHRCSGLESSFENLSPSVRLIQSFVHYSVLLFGHFALALSIVMFSALHPATMYYVSA